VTHLPLPFPRSFHSRTLGRNWLAQNGSSTPSSGFFSAPTAVPQATLGKPLPPTREPLHGQLSHARPPPHVPTPSVARVARSPWSALARLGAKLLEAYLRSLDQRAAPPTGCAPVAAPPQASARAGALPVMAGAPLARRPFASPCAATGHLRRAVAVLPPATGHSRRTHRGREAKSQDDNERSPSSPP
jgi:hypothetical protein